MVGWHIFPCWKGELPFLSLCLSHSLILTFKRRHQRGLGETLMLPWRNWEMYQDFVLNWCERMHGSAWHKSKGPEKTMVASLWRQSLQFCCCCVCIRWRKLVTVGIKETKQMFIVPSSTPVIDCLLLYPIIGFIYLVVLPINKNMSL